VPDKAHRRLLGAGRQDNAEYQPETCWCTCAKNSSWALIRVHRFDPLDMAWSETGTEKYRPRSIDTKWIFNKSPTLTNHYELSQSGNALVYDEIAVAPWRANDGVVHPESPPIMICATSVAG
jgi:hypothetical protein